MGRTLDPEVAELFTRIDEQVARTCDEIADLLIEVGARDSRTMVPGADQTALHTDLAAELHERVSSGGKRLRPLLAYWGWAADETGHDSGSFGDLVQVGTGLELLHTFALMQDDVMDRSLTRRGDLTLHHVAGQRHRDARGLGDPELFGDSVAVLVSDLALSEAARLGHLVSGPVSTVWRRMTVELVEGQLLDLAHAADRRRDLPTARLIGRLKSGRYTITRPLELGSTIARAPRAITEALVAWGDAVGDAFAMRDDVLGVVGDPAVTGKPVGDDLVEGKPTPLLAWASSMLPVGARPLLTACSEGRLDRAQAVELTDAMKAAGVFDRAEQTIAESVRTAESLLDRMTLPDRVHTALNDIAAHVAWRNA